MILSKIVSSEKLKNNFEKQIIQFSIFNLQKLIKNRIIKEGEENICKTNVIKNFTK